MKVPLVSPDSTKHPANTAVSPQAQLDSISANEGNS